MSTTTPIPRNWRPSRDDRIDSYLDTVLSSWKGTPSEDGIAVKGTRANCATFIWALLVELNHMRRMRQFSFRMNDVLHRPGPGMRALQLFLRTFPLRRISGRNVRPVDFMIAGLRHGGPAHLMVVGTRRNTVWHSTHAGVCQGGWVLPNDMIFMRVYRCDLRRWFR